MYDFSILKAMTVCINEYASKYDPVFSDLAWRIYLKQILSKVRLTQFITGTDSQIEPYSNPWDAGLHKIPVNVL